MIDLLISVVLFAANPGPRGENPESGGGVLIILGIVLVAALVGLALHVWFKRARAKPRAMERHPAPPGRVGRTSEFQDGQVR